MWWSCCVLYFLFLINFILWAECCGAVGISKMFYQVNSISRFYVGHQPPLYKASQSSDPLRCFLCFCDDFKTENRSNHLAEFTNQDNTDETLELSSLPFLCWFLQERYRSLQQDGGRGITGEEGKLYRTWRYDFLWMIKCQL